MIGLCPQHDILLDDLTPREHLSFIATLRVRLKVTLYTGSSARWCGIGQQLIGGADTSSRHIFSWMMSVPAPAHRRKLYMMLQCHRQCFFVVAMVIFLVKCFICI